MQMAIIHYSTHPIKNTKLIFPRVKKDFCLMIIQMEMTHYRIHRIKNSKLISITIIIMTNIDNVIFIKLWLILVCIQVVLCFVVYCLFFFVFFFCFLFQLIDFWAFNFMISIYYIFIVLLLLLGVIAFDVQ